MSLKARERIFVGISPIPFERLHENLYLWRWRDRRISRCATRQHRRRCQPCGALAAMRERGLKLLIGDEERIGRLTGIPTPALDMVLELVAQRGKIAGLYEGNVRPAETKTPVFA
jgi:hypothetical protein